MADKLRFMNFGLRLDVAHVFRAAASALRWDLRGVSPGYDVASTELKIQRDGVSFLVVEPEMGRWLDSNLRLGSVHGLPTIALVDGSPAEGEVEWMRQQGVQAVVRRPLEVEAVKAALSGLGLTHAGVRANTDEVGLAEILQTVAAGDRRLVTLSRASAPALSTARWEARPAAEAQGRVYISGGQVLHAESSGLVGVAALSALLRGPSWLAAVESFELEAYRWQGLGQLQSVLMAAASYEPPVASMQPGELQLATERDYIWAGGSAAASEDSSEALSVSLAPGDGDDAAEWAHSEAPTLIPPGLEGLDFEAPRSTPFSDVAAEYAAHSLAVQSGRRAVAREGEPDELDFGSLLPPSDVRAGRWQHGAAAAGRITPVPASGLDRDERVGALASSAAGIVQVIALTDEGEVVAHAGAGDTQITERFATATCRALDPLHELGSFMGLGGLLGFGTSAEVGAAAEVSGSFIVAARGVRTMDPKRTLVHLRRCRENLEAGSSLVG